jgi:hypothetical protein
MLHRQRCRYLLQPGYSAQEYWHQQASGAEKRGVKRLTAGTPVQKIQLQKENVKDATRTPLIRQCTLRPFS